MLVNWNSGSQDTIYLENSKKSSCLPYTHAPNIEDGLKITIKETYMNSVVGLQYINVFIKSKIKFPNFSLFFISNNVDFQLSFNFLESGGRIYNIESTNNVKYYLPDKENSFFIGFKVLGVSNENVNKCSSFVISLKDQYSIQVEMKIDEITRGKKLSTISRYNPSFLSVQLNISQLISCENWIDLWILITRDEVRFGIGKIYSLTVLGSIKGEFSTKLTQILFRNSLEDIVNQVEITDKSKILFFFYFHIHKKKL